MNKFISFLISYTLSTQIALAKHRNWNYSLELSISRCFEARNAKVWCDDFSFLQGKKQIKVQELQIEAVDYNGRKRSYGYGSAIEGPLCQEHLKTIQLLLRGTDQACVTGDDENQIGPLETFSRWRGLETKNGEINW